MPAAARRFSSKSRLAILVLAGPWLAPSQLHAQPVSAGTTENLVVHGHRPDGFEAAPVPDKAVRDPDAVPPPLAEARRFGDAYFAAAPVRPISPDLPDDAPLITAGVHR